MNKPDFNMSCFQFTNQTGFLTLVAFNYSVKVLELSTPEIISLLNGKLLTPNSKYSSFNGYNSVYNPLNSSKSYIVNHPILQNQFFYSISSQYYSQGVYYKYTIAYGMTLWKVKIDFFV